MQLQRASGSRVRFSNWLPWSHREDYAGTDYPGVYVIAWSDSALDGRPFSWRQEIIYIGMTNSVAGLRGRLRQFDNTIAGRRTEHGGADRVRYRYRSYKRLQDALYVAVAAFGCDPTSNSPRDLRTMGRIAQCEYECLAIFVQRLKRLPAFNDKKTALKYSLTHRKRARRARRQA